MTFLLDTNFCVICLRGKSSQASTRLAAAQPGTLRLCSVVVAELIYGAYCSARPSRTLNETRSFCAQFVTLPFDDAAAEEYGRIRSHLESGGTPIGPNDLMIAAIALANDSTLVTHNMAEFQRVPGLQVEDWQAP